MNGNKRTAFAIAQKILGSKVSPSTIRDVVGRAAQGQLRSVEDIAAGLLK